MATKKNAKRIETLQTVTEQNEQPITTPEITEQPAAQAAGNPTLRPLILAFENAFNLANRQFYGGELEQPVITIQQGAKARAYGWVSREKVWHEETGGEYRELNISAEYLQRGFDEVACTLLHEMIHVYNMGKGIQDCARAGIRHNQKFAEAGNAHGMEAYKGEDYAKAGWRVRRTEETAAWANETLTELKDALTFYRDANPQKTRAKTSSVIKYVCPCCGGSVRATKPIRIICADCEEEMAEE